MFGNMTRVVPVVIFLKEGPGIVRQLALGAQDDGNLVRTACRTGQAAGLATRLAAGAATGACNKACRKAGTRRCSNWCCRCWSSVLVGWTRRSGHGCWRPVLPSCSAGSGTFRMPGSWRMCSACSERKRPGKPGLKKGAGRWGPEGWGSGVDQRRWVDQLSSRSCSWWVPSRLSSWLPSALAVLTLPCSLMVMVTWRAPSTGLALLSVLSTAV